MKVWKSAGLAVLAAIAVPMGAFAMNVNMDSGTLINGHLQQEISSKSAQDGQQFVVQTDGGSRIYGHLSDVKRADIGRKAHLTMNLDRIRFSDGTSAPLSAKVVAFPKKAQTNYVRAAGTILGGMVVGNILGKAVGTNIGGIVGAAGGGLLAANTASDIDVPNGAAIQVQLTQPLVVRRQSR